MGNKLPSEVVFVKNSSIPTIVITLKSATVALFVQNRLCKCQLKLTNCSLV